MAFKAKNDAQTTSDLLQTNFQKAQKTTFLAPKMVKMTLSEGKIFDHKFWFQRSYINLLSYKYT